MNNLDNNFKLDYSKEDLLEYYTNKILLNWIKEHKPELIDKVKEFVNRELSNN